MTAESESENMYNKDEQFSNIEFTDRYKIFGIPYPNPETMCEGRCEGMGFFPNNHGDWDNDVRIVQAWYDAHIKHCLSTKARLICIWRGIYKLDMNWIRTGWNKCDGWHFITCPDCNGTRLKKI